MTLFANRVFSCLFGILTCFLAPIVGYEALVGGHLAVRNQFPYQVSVQVHGHGYECGGGVIDEKFILTAARCVLNHDLEFINPHISIHAGTVNYYRTDPPAVTVQVEKIFVPADFVLEHMQTTDDIAVVKLLDPLVFSAPARFQKLQLPLDDTTEEMATIAGFGWHTVANVGLRISGHSDGRLRYANPRIFPKEACVRAYPGGAIRPHKHLCAAILTGGPHDAFSVCVGDAGSPLVENRTTVVGILSRLAPHCDERQLPAVYTRVFYYRTMIDNVMRREHDPHMRVVYPFP